MATDKNREFLMAVAIIIAILSSTLVLLCAMFLDKTEFILNLLEKLLSP